MILYLENRRNVFVGLWISGVVALRCTQVAAQQCISLRCHFLGNSQSGPVQLFHAELAGDRTELAWTGVELQNCMLQCVVEALPRRHHG